MGGWKSKKNDNGKVSHFKDEKKIRDSEPDINVEVNINTDELEDFANKKKNDVEEITTRGFWNLDTWKHDENDNPVELDDMDLEHIGRMVREGYTSGEIFPNGWWTLELNSDGEFTDGDLSTIGDLIEDDYSSGEIEIIVDHRKKKYDEEQLNDLYKSGVLFSKPTSAMLGDSVIDYKVTSRKPKGYGTIRTGYRADSTGKYYTWIDNY